LLWIFYHDCILALALSLGNQVLVEDSQQRVAIGKKHLLDPSDEGWVQKCPRIAEEKDKNVVHRQLLGKVRVYSVHITKLDGSGRWIHVVRRKDFDFQFTISAIFTAPENLQ